MIKFTYSKCKDKIVSTGPYVLHSGPKNLQTHLESHLMYGFHGIRNIPKISKITNQVATDA